MKKHFTAQVDFTGDCYSDLIIVSSKGTGSVLEFYTKETNSKFSAPKILSFDEEITFMTVEDIDGSGTIDIVIVVKNQQGSEEIRVLYNTYNDLPEICKPFRDFAFNLNNMRKLDIGNHKISDSTLHFGDSDSDSYPDMLAIVTMNDFRKVILFKNIDGDGQSIRKFVPSTDSNINQISEIKNPREVTFFDFGEDGRLDIIVMVEETKSSDGSVVYTRSCFINNVKDDTLFIKILPLSTSSEYSIGSKKLANAFGVTIQWKITKLDGYKKISLLSQKSQWNHGTLQLPFSCGGLGRTNNYVEDLTIVYPEVGEMMRWSPIIPDSKLLVYQKEGTWKLETLLTNSDRVNHVIYVAVAILVVLGIVIFLLNYKENKEDRKDQYNFIQLIR